MRYLSEIFWRHSWDVCKLVPNNSGIHVCLSVCQLAYFLTETIQIWGYLQFWKRFLSEIFQRHSQDESTLVLNNSEFLVCLSFCQLPYFLTEIRQIQNFFVTLTPDKSSELGQMLFFVLKPNKSQLKLSTEVIEMMLKF